MDNNIHEAEHFDQFSHFDREKLIWSSRALSPNATLVLLAINSFVGADGLCFPKQSTLANMTKMTRASVNRILRDLSSPDRNFIKKTPRFRADGGQSSSSYQVLWRNIEAANKQEDPPTGSANLRSDSSSTQGGIFVPSNDRGCNTELQGGVTQSYRGCNTELQGGVTQSYTSNYPVINCPIEEEYKSLSAEPDNICSFQSSSINDEGSLPVEAPPQDPTGQDGGLLKEDLFRRAGSRSSKKRQESSDATYRSLADPDGFNSFWQWYRLIICAIGGASPGSKVQAARAWAELEANDFRGKGRQGFRLGCAKYLVEAQRTKGVGTKHACRYLVGNVGDTPLWEQLIEDQAMGVNGADFLAGISPHGEAPAVGVEYEIVEGPIDILLRQKREERSRITTVGELREAIADVGNP
jgi:Helix-turn-helix domain